MAETLSGLIHIFDPASANAYFKMYSELIYWDDTATSILRHQYARGSYNGLAAAINAVRILPSAGTITKGNFALYGLRKS